MNNWKDIWNKEDRVNDIVLQALVKADGFDEGAGSFNLDDWKAYTAKLFEKLNISNMSSIYDVGCGSGAFVYPLYLKNYKVGGGRLFGNFD
jgi:2-polyprenyl-3-methyl-5-hydroxy-6-metoxy-1,4-benzoquinol methylase